MAVHSSKAHSGKSTHGSKPSSKMSSHKHVTKPETRHANVAPKSEGAAESILRKQF